MINPGNTYKTKPINKKKLLEQGFYDSKDLLKKYHNKDILRAHCHFSICLDNFVIDNIFKRKADQYEHSRHC